MNVYIDLGAHTGQMLRRVIKTYSDDFDLFVFQDSWFMRKKWKVDNLHTFKTQTWKWRNGDGWVGAPKLWTDIFGVITQPKISTKLYL